MTVAALSEVPFSDTHTFEKTFNAALANRKTALTELNATSSRSHSVFTLHLTHVDPRAGKKFAGKVHLIDLAGNEDNRQSGNQGKRLTESSNINKSIFTLGKVIDALNSGSQAARIPYRDSKLTRLLQEALGGSNYTVMISNIAPGDRFKWPTLRTLDFASKGRAIVNRVLANESDVPAFGATRADSLTRSQTSALSEACQGLPSGGCGSVESDAGEGAGSKRELSETELMKAKLEQWRQERFAKDGKKRPMASGGKLNGSGSVGTGACRPATAAAATLQNSSTVANRVSLRAGPAVISPPAAKRVKAEGPEGLQKGLDSPRKGSNGLHEEVLYTRSTPPAAAAFAASHTAGALSPPRAANNLSAVGPAVRPKDSSRDNSARGLDLSSQDDSTTPAHAWELLPPPAQSSVLREANLNFPPHPPLNDLPQHAAFLSPIALARQANILVQRAKTAERGGDVHGARGLMEQALRLLPRASIQRHLARLDESLRARVARVEDDDDAPAEVDAQVLNDSGMDTTTEDHRSDPDYVVSETTQDEEASARKPKRRPARKKNPAKITRAPIGRNRKTAGSNAPAGSNDAHFTTDPSVNPTSSPAVCCEGVPEATSEVDTGAAGRPGGEGTATRRGVTRKVRARARAVIALPLHGCNNYLHYPNKNLHLLYFPEVKTLSQCTLITHTSCRRVIRRGSKRPSGQVERYLS